MGCQVKIAKNPDLSTLESYFDIDDFILVNKDNGSLQNEGFSEDIAYKFQDYCDGEFLYGAVVALIDPIGSSTSNGNGNSTNIRLWFRTNKQATVYTTFLDISFAGYTNEPVLLQKVNTSLTENKAAADPVDTSAIEVESVAEVGYWFVQYKIPLSQISANNSFDYYVTLSNGKQDAGTTPEIKNNALIYPAVPIDETARLANFPYNKWADTAIEVSLKGVQVEGDVKYNYPSLAKLVDGVYADDATEFSDSRLVSFQWENFS